eukprot:5690603-Amphidinium_carterae.1
MNKQQLAVVSALVGAGGNLGAVIAGQGEGGAGTVNKIQYMFLVEFLYGLDEDPYPMRPMSRSEARFTGSSTNSPPRHQAMAPKRDCLELDVIQA